MKKKNSQEVEQEVRQRLQEIELYQEEARQQGMAFSCLTKDQLADKAKGITANSPYIYAQTWVSGTSPGSNAYYQVYVANPDPGGYYPLFASIFFGVANFNRDISEAISRGNFNENSGWPYMSSQPFSLASGATTNLIFNYPTPAAAPLTTYIGNCVLWRGSFHDIGDYLDRGMFYVRLF